MPKVTKDDLLFEKVVSFVERQRSYESAAARLRVNTTTLWRFVQKGTAITRTRQALTRGLAQAESEMLHRTSLYDHHATRIATVSEEHLKEMRALCGRMVTWLDMAEQVLASSRATGVHERGQQVSGEPR